MKFNNAALAVEHSAYDLITSWPCAFSSSLQNVTRGASKTWAVTLHRSLHNVIKSVPTRHDSSSFYFDLVVREWKTLFSAWWAVFGDRKRFRGNWSLSPSMKDWRGGARGGAMGGASNLHLNNAWTVNVKGLEAIKDTWVRAFKSMLNQQRCQLLLGAN